MPNDSGPVRTNVGSAGRLAATEARLSASAAPRPEPAQRRLILAACLMATFMAAVESSIVATAIPTLVGDLGGFNLFSWVFTIYLLTQAVSIPVYGRLADVYGRKPMFFAGAGLFLVGSTLCGFAPNMLALIGFRALQGFGAGGIMPITSTILGDIYTPTERAKVQGLVSSVFGISAVIGPSLGAFLIQHLNWSVVFWVNLPIGVTAMTMIGLFLQEHITPKQHRIDWLGSLLLFAAVSLLLMVLVQGGSLGWRWGTGIFLIGIAAMLALAAHETTTAEPMLPLELWRNRIIVVGSLGNGASGALMMGVSAFLPTYVQGAMGRSPLMGGLVLGAMSVSWAIFSFIGGRIMMRTSYRLVAMAGATALTTGCLMLVMLQPTTGLMGGPSWAAAASFVIGIGMGFCSTTFIVSVQASVPWRQRGAATSSTMFLRFIGQSLGAAGCGAVLNLSVLHLDSTAPGKVNRLLDPVARAMLSSAQVEHLTAVMSGSLHNAYLLALSFGMLTLLVASRLPNGLRP